MINEHMNHNNFPKFFYGRLCVDKILYVYVVKESFMGYYKIGISNDVVSRIKSILYSLPQDLEILIVAKFDNPEEIERKLHIHFREKRIKGEWFNLDENDIQYLYEFFDKFRNKDVIPRRKRYKGTPEEFFNKHSHLTEGITS